MGPPHPSICGTFFAGICLAGIPVLLRICLSTMSSDCHLRFCSYLLEGVSPQVEVPAEEHGGKCYKLLVSVLSSGPEEIRIILISILLPKIPDPWASNQRCFDCWQKIDHLLRWSHPWQRRDYINSQRRKAADQRIFNQVVMTTTTGNGLNERYIVRKNSFRT